MYTHFEHFIIHTTALRPKTIESFCVMLLHQLSKPGNGKRMANSSTDCFRAAIFPFTASSSASLALNSLSVGPQLLWISCDNLIPEDTQHKQLSNAYTEYTARVLWII